MRAVKYCVITSLVLLLALGLVWGQRGGDRGNRPDRAERAGQQRGMRGGMMMGGVQRIQRVLDGLELTDQQKQTVEAFQVEYTEKIQPLTEKMRDKGRAMRDRMQNDPDDAEGLRQMREEMNGLMQDMIKATEEFTEKVKGELTEEQKTKFDQALAGGGRGNRVNRMIDALMPVNRWTLRELNLTEEQQKKYDALAEEFRVAVEKLRADYGEKFKELLTDDQKKKLEELEANPPRMDRNANRDRRQNRRQGRQGGQGGQGQPPDAF